MAVVELADKRPEPRGAKSPMLWLGVLFLASRVAFYAAGVRFDLRPLDTSWQILDPVLLREELLRSAFYMPGQPPLYNLVLGAVLKLSRDPELLSGLFRTLYSGLALGASLLMYRLLQCLFVPLRVRFFLTALFMLSPALILYESLPYYELLVLALLCASAVLFEGTLRSFSLGRASLLFFTLAALIFVRSLFQIYWFLVLLGFCLLVLPERRKQVATAALIPLLLVLGLYGKNLAVTGHFATSSWLGMSWVKLSVFQLPPAEREQLARDGKLSDLSLMPGPFEAPERLGHYFARLPASGIRVLDQPRKSTQHVNYNHLAYVDVSRRALHDALYVMKTQPAVYLGSVARAFRMFLCPASDYPFLKENRFAIDGYSRAYARLIAGQPRYPVDPMFEYEPGQVGYGIALGYLVSVLFGAMLFVRAIRRRRIDAADATLVFLWLNILYVSIVGNSFELGENQRFRLALHPFIIAMLAVCALRRLRWSCRRA